MARLNRGQLWVADLDPAFGIEIHKKRPVLVISVDKLNQYLPTVIVVPVSTLTHQPGPEKVFLSKGTAGLTKDSVLLPAEIRSIDKKRLIKKTGKVPNEKLLEVEESLKLVLGLTPLE